MGADDKKEIEIKFHEYFDVWFEDLSDAKAKGKIQTKIVLMRKGNFGDSESVGKGVIEAKVHFGPGYRIYYGRKGKTLVVLLAGSRKKDQKKAIAQAQEVWSKVKKIL